MDVSILMCCHFLIKTPKFPMTCGGYHYPYFTNGKADVNRKSVIARTHISASVLSGSSYGDCSYSVGQGSI